MGRGKLNVRISLAVPGQELMMSGGNPFPSAIFP